MRLTLLGLAVSMSLLLVTPSLAATRGLQLGFLADEFSSPDPEVRTTYLNDAVSTNAEVVRIQLVWRSAAVTRPSVEKDPNDPAYAWANIDAAVADASARGLRVLLAIAGAPAWAEGPGRPRNARPGTWKPNPQALAAFAEAAARRYPTVRSWQIWNEPNLVQHLTPSWTRSHGRYLPSAPRHYRRMLNASYAALKRVNPANLVVTAGLGPYGDPPGRNTRVHPVTFWREVFRKATRFDVFAHHPYSVAGPKQHAFSPLDVSVPDLGRLTRVVRSALRRGTALPRRAKPVWITELAWDSKPPDPTGVPADRLARWVSQALYILWKQGADVVLWYQVRDQPPTGGYDVTNQSGLYLRSGVPKLAERAFAFPLACERLARGRLRVWGKAPTSGSLELVRGSQTLRRLAVSRGQVFVTTVHGSSRLSARVGNQTSRTCSPI